MATRAFLLCGDEKAVHAVTQILDELDVSFEHSGEPPFALKRLAAQRFDLLIVDCDNAQNATQVFNSARASNLNKSSIAIAIVEGKAGVPNAFRLGASLVLTKPVSLEQARNTLRTGIGMTKKDVVEAKPAAVAPVVTPTPASLVLAPLTSVPSTSAPAAPAAHVPAPTLTPANPAPVAPHPAAPAPVPPAPVAKVPVVPAVPLTAVAPSAPAQAKPAASSPVEKQPLLPKAPSPTPAPAQEHKPALTDFSESKTQPTIGVTAAAKAAAAPSGTSAAGTASATSKFDSVFASTSSTVAKTEKKTAEDKNKSLNLSDAKEPVLRIEDPLAYEAEALDPLKDHGVPSFGALGRQPFAGFDEEKPARSKAPLIAALVLVVLGGGAYAAWTTQPNFRAFMSWEYGNVHGKVDAMRGKAPVTAAAKPQAAPAPPAPVQPAPPSAPQNPENIDLAVAPGATASTPADPAAATNAATNAPAPAAASPAPAPSSNGDAAPEKPATLQSAKKDATPGHAASLVPASASLPPTTTAKATPTDLFEVPEDFADDQVVHRVHPTYPKQAIVKKLHGSVVLQAIISKQGKVDSLQLVSGDPILAQAAAAAVKQWRYKPYWHNNEPTDFQTRVTVDFKLP
jgi:protein TonB